MENQYIEVPLIVQINRAKRTMTYCMLKGSFKKAIQLALEIKSMEIKQAKQELAMIEKEYEKLLVN